MITLSTIGLTALSLSSIALKFGGENLSVASDMINLFLSGPTGEKLGSVYKQIEKLRREIQLPVNADIEKCSRDALIKSVIVLIDDTLVYLDGQDQSYLFLTHLSKQLKKELRQISVLSEIDEVLTINPGNHLSNLNTILIEGNVATEDSKQLLQIELANHVLKSIKGLKEQLLLPRQHAAFHVLARSLRDGWKDCYGKNMNFLSVFAICLRDNLKNDDPEYCKRAREILKHKQLAELNWGQQEISLQLKDVLDNTHSLLQQFQNLQELFAEFREYRTMLNRQPYLPIEVEWDSNQIHLISQARKKRSLLLTNYRYQEVPLVGREDALKDIDEFLKGDPNCLFSWWAIVGPGGSGKSRLAYDACYLLFKEEDWHAGFIRQSGLIKSFPSETWKPLGPTLLVFDYVAQNVSIIEEKLLTFIPRLSEFDYPVRWLLLERDPRDYNTNEFTPKPNWWQQLAGNHTINSYLYENSPLQLKPIESEDRWEIIRTILEAWEVTLPDPVETRKSLDIIDPEGRPLFAIMAAIALATTGNIRDWTADQLISYLTNRELNKFWLTQSKNGEISHTFYNLQSLVTLCYGLTRAQLERIKEIQPDWLPNLKELDEQQQLLEALLPPYPNEFLWLHPLQPDIIGEFIILERLKSLSQRSLSGNNIEIQTGLIDLAWELDPSCTAQVIYRIFNDHPLRDEKKLLTNCLPQAPTENRVLWQTALGVEIIGWFGNKGQRQEASSLYSSIQKLASHFPNTPQIALYQAMAGFNLIIIYGDAWELGQAQLVYEDLQALVNRWPEAQLALQQAMAGLKLITVFDSAWELGGDLQLLMIQQTSAKSALGAFNLKSYHSKSREFGRTQLLYEDLKTLANRWPEEIPLAIQQARAGVNLITDYSKTGKLDKAQVLYEDLKALVNRWPKEVQLAIQQAMAGVSLITVLGNAEALDKAQPLYTDLQFLANRWPKEDLIALQQVIADYIFNTELR